MIPHSVEVDCCIEVPSSLERKARYALESLLIPLRIRLNWVDRSVLSGKGLYYGLDPAGLPDSVVSLACSAEASDYFSKRTLFDPERVTWAEWDSETWPALFRNERSREPDLVASAFFWLSGWQEHTTTERDQHGRFPFSASLQYRLGTPTRPVVDAYRSMLQGLLNAKGIPAQPRSWGEKGWAFCPTVDIDYARKWRVRSLAREFVSAIHPGERGGVPMGKRMRRFAGTVRSRYSGGDPYVVAMKRIIDEIERRDGKATFFFKAGAYSPQDVPYSLSDPALKDRIEEIIAAGFEVGLHPGFHAHTHLGHMRAELERLQAITRVPLLSVRQHYLRFDGSLTPRLQRAAGFRIDSTLGFSEQEGFRNGTCLPFLLYDVVEDEPLPIWEMPVAAMDAALFNRRMLDVEGACRAAEELLREVRRFGGVCVVIWHNVLWDERDHSGWGEHFLRTLDRAETEGALVGSLQGALRAWMMD